MVFFLRGLWLLCLWSMGASVLAQAVSAPLSGTAGEAVTEVPVVVANRTIPTFRAPYLGVPPERRAQRTEAIPSEPRPRAEVLSSLHANNQDVFNERGVQVMSPHYLSDPAEPKRVPAGERDAPPSRQPDSTSMPG